ncbi:MAG: glycosyl hydrolase family 65 protein, partial [Gemmatimonadaceae bacterium]
GHVGRGGWTWYTGAAGWMYRVAIETVVGLHKRGTSLTFDPCIPSQWHDLHVEYRYRDTLYDVRMLNPTGVNRGVTSVRIDGVRMADGVIPLTEGRGRVEVVIELGSSEGSGS